jgi:alpha-tubulin suppressor-like RCC1 family protein
MAETTRKGVWDLQQVRDQILDNVWEQQFELYSWGLNNGGQLGQNNRTYFSSPVQIPGTTWSSISAGRCTFISNQD